MMCVTIWPTHDIVQIYCRPVVITMDLHPKPVLHISLCQYVICDSKIIFDNTKCNSSSSFLYDLNYSKTKLIYNCFWMLKLLSTILSCPWRNDILGISFIWLLNAYLYILQKALKQFKIYSSIKYISSLSSENVLCQWHHLCNVSMSYCQQ